MNTEHINTITSAPKIDIKNVKTIPNNGSTENFTNSCLFISLQHFFNRTNIPSLLPYRNILVYELRKIGNFPGKNGEMFDSNSHGHLLCLTRISTRFSLKIFVYSNTNENLVYQRGNGQNIVKILQFGINHFELIDDSSLTSIKHNIQEKNFVSKNENINKMFEKIKDINNKINDTELKIIKDEYQRNDIQDRIANYKCIVDNLDLDTQNIINNVKNIDFIIQNNTNDDISYLVIEKLHISAEKEQIRETKNECTKEILNLEKQLECINQTIKSAKDIIQTYRKEILDINNLINKMFD
jgi:hypothetical protein